MTLGGVQNKNYCLPCLRGWHTTCRKPCTCEHKLGETNATIVSGSRDKDSKSEVVSTGDGESTAGETTDEALHQRSIRTRRSKRDDALKDQQSTGRKRAARLYPFLDKNGNRLKYNDDASLFRDCEWAGKTNCGGGTAPISGCGLDGRPVGKGNNRHHGPDKNTLNNEPGNVHRICASCHNRWHAANDPDYDPNKPLKH